ncbi:MAG: hypothetical protein JXA20_17940 [Spirochaetes bacterium]|nr:hypothetical protein [Spirochaetota bacterium]
MNQQINLIEEEQPGLWKLADLARWRNCSIAKCKDDVLHRRIPFIKDGRSIRFDPEVIKEFLKARVVEPMAN